MTNHDKTAGWKEIRHEINNICIPGQSEFDDDPRWAQLGEAAKIISTLRSELEEARKERDRLRQWHRDILVTITRGRRSYVGDHYIYSPQIDATWADEGLAKSVALSQASVEAHE